MALMYVYASIISFPAYFFAYMYAMQQMVCSSYHHILARMGLVYMLDAESCHVTRSKFAIGRLHLEAAPYITISFVAYSVMPLLIVFLQVLLFQS